MASKKGNKVQAVNTVNTAKDKIVNDFITLYEKEDFIRVMGGKFLASGYSLEEGIKHAVTSKTITLGLLKKILSYKKLFKDQAGFEDCEKSLFASVKKG
jgi:hypothetical protein